MFLLRIALLKFSSLLFLFLIVALSAQSRKSTLERIIQRDTLILGTAGDYPPFSAVTKSGTVIGFDIDLAQQIADALGVTLRIDLLSFNELISSVENGTIDFAASGITITPLRNVKILFVGPYYTSGKSLLTKNYHIGLSGTDASANKIVVVKGTTSADVAADQFAGATLVKVNDFDEGIKLLLAGKVTALVADFPYCSVISYHYRDRGISKPQETFSFEPIGIAINKDSYHFANWVQNFLINLEGSGELKELNEKWFADMSWVSQLQDLP